KRLALIRIFAFLSAVVTVIIIASGLLRTIVHFMLKDALISECTALATGQDVFIHWGFWGSDTHEQLTASQASQFCHKAWDHDSFSGCFARSFLCPCSLFLCFPTPDKSPHSAPYGMTFPELTPLHMLLALRMPLATRAP
ncbi:hypothetical protein F5148DRAFT_1250815, partial [Russula earlei]